MRDRSGEPLADFRRVNVEGTGTLARSAIDQGVGRFVFLSSIKVYGERTHESRYSASSPTRPVDPYGISKLEAEQVIREAADGTGMSIVVIRTPLVYGPGVCGNFERILKLAHSKLPLPCSAVAGVCCDGISRCGKSGSPGVLRTGSTWQRRTDISAVQVPHDAKR